ncbi:MAG TPA: cupin [Candidatus Saccharimonadia bacterium]|nr:cupin [Candidatus Saccharimonadia bacterium]
MSIDEAPVFDPKNFSIEPYAKRVEKPWGYELHLVPSDAPYMAKIMHVNAGCRQSLQVHDSKTETYTMLSGRAAVLIENSAGTMVQVEIEQGKGLSTKVGQKHRIIAITDCDVFEASTPESGTTWRLEDDYTRPNETPDQRKKERGE